MRLAVLFFLFSCFCGFGQSRITLHGTAHFTDGTPVSGAAIFLVHGSDTVASVFSGSDGKYAFPDTLAHDDGYAVHGSYFCHRSSVAPLKLSALEYDLNLELDFPFMRIMDCPKMDNSAYFAAGDFRTILNFEPALLRRLLETTGFEVTFSSMLLPEEPKHLARRRMRTFRRLLKAEQIDRDRIVLSREVRRYDPEQPDEYPRLPGIRGIIRGE